MSKVMTTSDLSIVIPVARGETCWRQLVSEIPKGIEILLVGPEKPEDFEPSECLRWVFSEQGRGRQLNCGALKARGPFLWFVHADTRLQASSTDRLLQALKNDPRALYYFDLKFSDGPGLLWLNEWGTFFRSRVLRLPFGDMAFCCHRSLWLGLGGYPEGISYGEDHEFIWRAHLKGVPVCPLRSAVWTSGRKYSSTGWFSVTLRHLVLTAQQAWPYFGRYLRQRIFGRSVKEPLRIGVAAFVKTPGISAVKTRLAQRIGKKRAEEFYLLAVQGVKTTLTKVMSEIPGLDGFWAVAEEEGLSHSLWQDFPRVFQGQGELGERLAQIHKELKAKYDYVIFIGADCPQLSPEHIYQVILQMKEGSKFIIGPALDGGFYLFAGPPRFPAGLWKKVPYSVSSTAVELHKSLQTYGEVISLEPLFDVDELEDLKQLAELEQFSPDLRELVGWSRRVVEEPPNSGVHPL